MGDKTKIEWSDATWNPTTGCDRCSPGCDNCYALGVAARLKAMGQANYQNDGDPRTSGPGFGVTCHPHMLDIPLRWKRPRRIFVNSMSDLFHPDVPDGFIVAVWEVMRQSPQHTFQILTKRPTRMASWVKRWHDVTGEDLMPKLARGPEATRAAHPSPKGQLWADYLVHIGEPPDGYTYPTFDWMNGPLRMMPTTPLPNVWLGVSIENDTYSWRANHLRNTPAAVRFISAEPLLGPLPSLDLTGIDWLIVGGESGPNARPMHPDWVRDLRDRCNGDFACSGSADGEHRSSTCSCPCDDVAFFFKQWGAWAPIEDDLNGTIGRWVGPNGSTYSTPGTLADERELMSRFGKHAAGRELDGRTWDEIPEVSR